MTRIIALTLAFAATALAQPALPRDPLSDAQQQRHAKADYLWRTAAPWSYSPRLVEHFIAEHERLGIGPEWYWSAVYGFSNFGLTVGKRAPGLCYSPMDVKWPGFARQAGCRRPNDLRDPYYNVTAHCLEMAHYHGRTGETGMALLARVFYPARPMRYHRWADTDRRFRGLLGEWYLAEARKRLEGSAG